jgi:hypothetical protein
MQMKQETAEPHLAAGILPLITRDIAPLPKVHKSECSLNDYCVGAAAGAPPWL